MGDSSTITAALEAAQLPIRETVAAAVTEASTALLGLMQSAPTYRERTKIADAQTHLLKTRDALLAAFAAALREKVREEMSAKMQERAFSDPTDWQAVGLVDEDQIEERLSFERIGQFISHECDAELRELTAYMSSMLRHGSADPERNPLRGNVIGWALHQAIEKTTDANIDMQRLLARELGQPLAKSMPACYLRVVADLGGRGFRKSDLAVRATHHSAPAASAPAMAAAAMAAGDVSLDEARKVWERSMIGRPPADAATPLRSWESSILGRHGNFEPLPDDLNPETSAALLDRLIRGGLPGAPGRGAPVAPANPAPALADAELMSLLRRLNGGDTVRSDLDDLPHTSGIGSGRFAPERSVVLNGPSRGAVSNSGHGELMAANLIRAHRSELLQASQGKLDHMLIEVVSSLFDQILSDSRVAPQMARQIARLQLPVLRVAMRDTSFFSSRKHPVRRFINRVSALGTGFSDFDSGAGEALIVRVGVLVTEIVEGDFDQIGLYGEKLLELERITAELARTEIEASPAGQTLQAKEREWRLQHRFGLALHGLLEPTALPAFLKAFFSQVWSQVILTATQNDGADSAADRRFRKAAFDLVVSIQPKRSPEQRAYFLAHLRALMATLNEGAALIAWPQAASDAFFGQLMAEHAGSLKAAPGTELNHNMMLRDLEAAFRTPVPTGSEADDDAAVQAASQAFAFEPRFSVDEARKVGLIGEGQVDWSSAFGTLPADHADAESTADDDAAAVAGAATTATTTAVTTLTVPDASLDPDAFPVLIDPAEPISVTPSAAKPDIDPDALAADPDEPTEGPQLRHHLQLGTSYQLHLKDQWEKARLTYMSPSRTLFLFTYGSKDRGTISMTARMLERLCESRRLKAFESASLVDRATERARKQLLVARTEAAPALAVH